MTDGPLYRLDRIKRIVGGSKVILDIDDLSLPRGELTAIAGPNGSGKSTLLNILAFLEKPERGSIHFQGEPVRPGDMTLLRREVTMVDQAPLLFKGTVFENVAFGLKVRRVPRDRWPGRVDEALSRVDLGDFAEREVAGLSGGERQRVAIARALIFQPQVILLDEPTAGVDVARMEMVESLIRDLSATLGVCILFSTHNLAQAHRLTASVIHLSDGKVVPESVENIFRGQAGEGDDAGLVRLHCGASVRTRSGYAGQVRLSIPAAAVEVEPWAASEEGANRFDSVITRMELRGAQVRLLLSGRLNLRADIRPEEFQRKGLGLGSRVAAVVPPQAIRILNGES